MVGDIYEMRSDDETLKFVPEQRLSDLKAAEDEFNKFLFANSTGVSFTHFITDKFNGKTIGLITIVAPELASRLYKMEKYEWMIEYLLNKNYCGHGLMTSFLKIFVSNMNEQGIKTIGAVCFRNNLASIRVLEKVGFVKKGNFDIYQDYYEN